jgi:hypothetical protein
MTKILFFMIISSYREKCQPICYRKVSTPAIVPDMTPMPGGAGLGRKALGPTQLGRGLGFIFTYETINKST